jgi:hypothetical protein
MATFLLADEAIGDVPRTDEDIRARLVNVKDATRLAGGDIVRIVTADEAPDSGPPAQAASRNPVMRVALHRMRR